jgi:hypothetical protein
MHEPSLPYLENALSVKKTSLNLLVYLVGVVVLEVVVEEEW